ncbi:nucleoside phosphatase family-domain-containing protein [Flammula alnicola]|nr:nucleoside phosphatase family-domain-containing protein [Flammula alnicola]
MKGHDEGHDAATELPEIQRRSPFKGAKFTDYVSVQVHPDEAIHDGLYLGTFTIINPLKEPVPVGPLVPLFYGYYMVDEEIKNTVGAAAGNNATMNKRPQYLSPILLLEDYGELIDPGEHSVTRIHLPYLFLLSSLFSLSEPELLEQLASIFTLHSSILQEILLYTAIMSSRPVDCALVLDAGSSGTRLYVYRWPRWNKEDGSPPVVENVYTKKQNGGIAEMVKGSDLRYEAMLNFEKALQSHLTTLAIPGINIAEKAREGAAKIFSSNDLQSAVNKHLEPLFKAAHEVVAAIQVNPKDIPLFLLGTAGIRDLNDDSDIGKRKYQDLLRCMRTSTQRAGFDMRECGAISGEAEALYGWIAANYSLGFFSGYGLRLSETVGYVEMGGASAQIAFMPHKVNQNYTGGMWKIRIGSLELDLFLGSYPFGMNLASETYRAALIGSAPGPEKVAKVINDPAKPRGLEEKFGEWKLKGAPNAEALKTKVSGVLTQLVAGAPFNPTLSAALLERKFVGGANFWYSTREIFGLDINGKPKNTSFSFTEFRNEVFRTSLLPWNALKQRTPNVNEAFLAGAWFKAAWVECVLTEYFKFAGTNGGEVQQDRLSFRPYNGSDGMELNWTLGRLILFITGDKPPAYMMGSAIIAINALRQDASGCELDASATAEIGLEYLHQALDDQEYVALDPETWRKWREAEYVGNADDARDASLWNITDSQWRAYRGHKQSRRGFRQMSKKSQR